MRNWRSLRTQFLIPHSSFLIKIKRSVPKRSVPYLCSMPVSLCYYYPAYSAPYRCEAALTWPG